MTHDQADGIIAYLVTMYPNRNVVPELIDGWVEQLLPLDYEATTAAAHAHVAESQYFPTVAEIRVRVLGPAAALPKPMTSADEQVRATYRRSMLSTIETLGWDRTVEMHGEERVREAVGARRYNELAAGAEVGLAAMMDAAERDASAAVEGGEACGR